MTDHLMSVYNRAPLAPVRGKGAWLFDESGEGWLDCVCGIATDGLGHAHPSLVAALTEQASKLWHVSNIFRIPGQELLAKRLTAQSFADVVFFGNSGSEAVECALKTARKYHSARGHPERIDIVGFDGSFHGRTYAAINAAGNPNYVEGFGPRLPGYVQIGFGDHDALKAAVASRTTAAVIIEPVQGEGGARAVPGECLQGLRSLCTEHGVLLIYDEVQSGMGRTGKLFAHQWFEDATPDIMAIAKALGGGFPVGACLATRDAASGMTVGVHGSTFGGNPLAMAVATAAFDEIAKADTLAHGRRVADYLKEGLEQLKVVHSDIILDIRGKGLLIGIKLVINNRAFMNIAREQRLLVAGGGDNCVRLLPPLTLTIEEADIVLERFDAACNAAYFELAA